ncbi:cation transporter [Tuanshanicoccus lijuaniae]|uniref:cation diffusion facilitator family transporter n=1 Tax=Aerococcaceae bacterium zg-1292 TaxID=2774330 RepID=UPI00193638BF|nr:cation transporter [Aerococcaceae bacterium zg-1292]MBS4456352.1 cation transporter [Aerococcaceae bacterium zg-A91]MBS4458232.1 cation transporter [Aerococcaceae bacterium zg-BR33]QQA37164.1 cation transporter [Aerococcaceae bacterium zg-1292]
MDYQKNTTIAARGAAIGIFIYLFLAVMKLITAHYFQSMSLQADGLNNLSDIFSSLSVFIGLQLAKKPADDDHHFDHSKFETLASFITAVIMFTIGFEVFSSSISRLIAGEYQQTDLKATYVSLISMLILALTRRSIKKMAIKTNSLGLKATVADMRNDLLISFGTFIGALGVKIGIPFLDTVISIIVSLLIIRTAFEIFKESSFVLSDGFDKEELQKYYTIIMKHPKVYNVSNLRARLSGNKIYVDVTIEIDGNLSVIESHHITEDIERILSYNYSVYDCDVHVEPYHHTNNDESR